MVRKDLADKIKKPSDLAGKNIDGAFLGSPISLLALYAIQSGGLSTADVHFTTKESGTPEQFGALQNKAVDVQGATEPTATAIQQQGIAIKWLGFRDVMPWYQENYWGVSGEFAKEHPDAVAKFLQAYIRGAEDVGKSGGKLTPDLIALISKWTEIPAETVRLMNGVPYFGELGAINSDSLERVQKVWVQLGLVKTPQPVSKIVDSEFLTAARKLPIPK
jgi:ABC-type nitrate/sulfonate/bicarbonate transport system substrate-binding protein